MAQSTDGGNTWGNVLITGVPASGVLVNASCGSNMCVAVGESFTNQSHLLVESINGGSWSRVSPTSGGGFNDVICTNANFCVAVGGDSSFAPYIAQTTSTLGVWAPQSVSGNPGSGSFLSASCSGNFCIAVGLNGNLGQVPLLAQITNSDSNWTVISLPGITSNGLFRASSCSGSLCIAVGEDDSASPNIVPLLALSTNGGTNWSIFNNANINPPLTNGGIFSSASCSGNLCVIAGKTNSNTPLLVQSTDGGLTWGVQTVFGATGGKFSVIDCSGLVCIAAGQDASNAPLLAQSTDGGSSWNVVNNVTGIPATGAFMGGNLFASELH